MNFLQQKHRGKKLKRTEDKKTLYTSGLEKLIQYERL